MRSFHSSAITSAVMTTRIPQLETLEIRRLMAAGDLDDTFDDDGRLTISGLGIRGSINAIAVQSDGKILAAGTGTSASGQSTDGVVLRFEADGSLDESFGNDGIYRLDFGGNERFDDLAVLPNGKILAGGMATATEFALVRLDPDGDADSGSGFGETDGVEIDTGVITDIAIQGDKILSAGGSTLRRHESDGDIDTSYGSSGVINVGSATGLDNYIIRDISVGPANLVYVGGEADAPAGAGRVAVVSRFEDEALDNGFGVKTAADVPVAGLSEIGGSVVSNIGNDDEFGGFAVEAGGGVYLAVQPDNQAGRMFHLSSNGTPEPEFGALSVTFGSSASASLIDDVALLNGAPVGSGAGNVSGQPSSTIDSGIARITRAGELDDNVSGDGIATADLNITSSNVFTQIINTPAGIVQLRSVGNDGLVTSQLFRYRSVPTGFTGEISLSAGGTLTYDGSDGDDKVFFQKVGDVIRVTAGSSAVEYAIGLVNNIKASGNDGDDRIVVDANLIIDTTLYGGSGNDKLIGGGRNDLISANGGSDTLLGGSGNDRLNGHGGNDDLYGEAGADRVFGYEGLDHLDGGSSGDRITGGSGRDTYFGQSGNDFFRADDGDQGEQIFGGSGTDTAIADFLDQVSSIEDLTQV